VEHAASVAAERLVKAIGAAGLEASVVRPDGKGAAGYSKGQRHRLASVFLSGLLTGIGLFLRWSEAGVPPEWTIAVFVAAIVSGGWFILPKAVRAAGRL